MSRPTAPLRVLALGMCVWALLAGMLLLAGPATAAVPTGPASVARVGDFSQVRVTEQVDRESGSQHGQVADARGRLLFWLPVQFLLIAFAGGLVVVRRGRD